MLTPRQNLPVKEFSTENISILLVSPHSEDTVALRHILHHEDWHIGHAGTVAEARDVIATHRPSVVLCERELPDGTWKDLLYGDRSDPGAPLLLIMSRHADEHLWAEVLNLGGYDVLMKPLDRSEVARVVTMAWRYRSGSSRSTKAHVPYYA